ncbi:MAG: hypothetical protein JXA90_01005, partial [Planctomycetes bacterium]|nr:hypothetical protein [Planctomycetota bacterium]
MEPSSFFLSKRACLVTICLLLVAGAVRAQCDPAFLRGDSNRDGSVDLSDGVSTLGYLFLGWSLPLCL